MENTLAARFFLVIRLNRVWLLRLKGVIHGEVVIRIWCRGWFALGLSGWIAEADLAFGAGLSAVIQAESRFAALTKSTRSRAGRIHFRRKFARPENGGEHGSRWVEVVSDGRVKNISSPGEDRSTVRLNGLDSRGGLTRCRSPARLRAAGRDGQEKKCGRSLPSQGRRVAGSIAEEAMRLAEVADAGGRRRCRRCACARATCQSASGLSGRPVNEP